MPYVSVYIDAVDALRDIDTDDLEAELARRCSKSKDKKSPRVVAIEEDALNDIKWRLASGDVDDALVHLERLLPHDFRHLSQDVARFYARPH